MLSGAAIVSNLEVRPIFFGISRNGPTFFVTTISLLAILIDTGESFLKSKRSKILFAISTLSAESKLSSR